MRYSYLMVCLLLVTLASCKISPHAQQVEGVSESEVLTQTESKETTIKEPEPRDEAKPVVKPTPKPDREPAEKSPTDQLTEKIRKPAPMPAPMPASKPSVKNKMPVSTKNKKPTQKSNDNIQRQKPSTGMKTIDEVMGKFDPAKHKDFYQIAKKHADRAGLYMERESYDAFISMFEAAKKDGITLVIRSAARNFDYQKGIWERKWTGVTKVEKQDLSKTEKSPEKRALRILEYSSMPGTSRHHWGTDIDLNAFENSYFEKGEGLKIYNWLVKNAGRYGFCQPYTAKGSERPEGYNEEKWHWSHKPVALKYYRRAEKSMNDSMIKGFKGSEVAEEIGVVEKYIFGINRNCK